MNRIRDPIVSLPSVPLFRSFVDAVECPDARLVVPDGHTDRLSWPMRSRLADLTDSGVDLREGPVETPVVAGENRVAVIDQSPRAPVAYLGEADTTPYVEQWQRAEAVDLDVCRFGEFASAAQSNLGDEARQTVTAIDKARTADVNPVSLLLWSAAVAEERFSAVVEAAQDADLCTRRTVQRRLDRLTEEGLVETRPAVEDQSRGRHDRHLRIGIETEKRVPQSVLSAIS